MVRVKFHMCHPKEEPILPDISFVSGSEPQSTALFLALNWTRVEYQQNYKMNVSKCSIFYFDILDEQHVT